MPEYYTNGNDVLGARPILRAPDPARPNWVLATLFLLLCGGAIAAMFWLRPAGGPTNLRASVTYVVARFDDGTIITGSGWLASPSGQVVTSAAVAWPRGPSEAPAQLLAFLNSQQSSQRQFTATAGPAIGPTATLQLKDAAPLNPLSPATDTTALVDGTTVQIAGYDPDSGSQTLKIVELQVKGLKRAGAQIESFQLSAPLPKGFEGAPVLDAAGGVLGTLTGAGSQGLVVPPRAAAAAPAPPGG